MTERLHEVLVKQICVWGTKHQLVCKCILEPLLAGIESMVRVYNERGDSSNLARLLELLTKCVEPMHGEVMRSAPWATPGEDQTLEELQLRFDQFIEEGDDTKWAAWAWIFEELTPKLMSMAPTRSVSTPATREFGYWLASALQHIGSAMGAPYVRDVLRPLSEKSVRGRG